MRVEVYTEIQAVKPHPSGGEMYDPDGEPNWKMQDALNSNDASIIASFLDGLAEDLDPLHSHSSRQPVPVTSMWRVVVYGNQRGQVEIPIVAEIFSRKGKVIASMLRGTAKSITMQQVSIGTIHE